MDIAVLSIGSVLFVENHLTVKRPAAEVFAYLVDDLPGSRRITKVDDLREVGFRMTEGSCHLHGAYRIRSRGERETLVSVSVETEPRGLQRLMLPLIGSRLVHEAAHLRAVKTALEPSVRPAESAA